LIIELGILEKIFPLLFARVFRRFFKLNVFLDFLCLLRRVQDLFVIATRHYILRLLSEKRELYEGAC
jgi:hypothetical protein